MRCSSNGEVFPLSGATHGRCEVNTCEMRLRANARETGVMNIAMGS